MNLPADQQAKTIPKHWVNNRFSLRDRLRQIQQGRDQLAVLKLLWQSESGYCRQQQQPSYDPNRDDRIFFFAEDDWDLCQGGSSEAERDAVVDWAVRNKARWTAIRMARGNGAMLLQCRDLPALTDYLQTRVGIPGVDWSLDKFLQQYQPTVGLLEVAAAVQGQDDDNNNNQTNTTTSTTTTTQTIMLPRLYRIVEHSLFRHNDGGVSTIWKGGDGDSAAAATNNRGEAGCDALRTKHTWYTGYSFQKCGGKLQNNHNDRFLVSPCWDHDLVPLPRLSDVVVTAAANASALA